MVLASMNFLIRPKGRSDYSGDLAQNVHCDIIRPVEKAKDFCLKPKTGPNVFTFPEPHEEERHSSRNSSGYGSLEHRSKGIRKKIPADNNCVVIETNGNLLTVDPFFFNVDLKKAGLYSKASAFRMQTLQTEVSEKGRTETVMLHLASSQEYYLTTTAERQLELNMFHDKTARLERPDSRFFTVYTTAAGQTLIQPALHKGFYLHHLGDRLDVQKLDLNWRAPEEFFFNIYSVEPEPEPEPEMKPEPEMRKELIEMAKVGTSDVSEFEPIFPIPSKMKKRKVSFHSLFLGCFSGKSRLVDASER